MRQGRPDGKSIRSARWQLFPRHVEHQTGSGTRYLLKGPERGSDDRTLTASRLRALHTN